MNAAEAVRRELEVLNRQDVEGVLAFYVDDVVFEDVSLPEPLVGKPAMREFMAGLYAAFPDARVEIRSLISDGRLAAAEYDLLGTNLGAFDGREPTGRTFRVKAVSVYEYNGTLFTRETFYWDSASMLRQAGLA